MLKKSNSFQNLPSIPTLMHWKNIKAFLSPILVVFQKGIAFPSFDLDKL